MTAEKNSAQRNRQTDRHNKNNGHLAMNQKLALLSDTDDKEGQIGELQNTLFHCAAMAISDYYSHLRMLTSIHLSDLETTN